jgi:hypothetical protein
VGVGWRGTKGGRKERRKKVNNKKEKEFFKLALSE